MPENIPSSDKEIGEAGHTDDHNLITLALVNIDGRLVAVETDTQNMITTDEGVTISIDNTTHQHFAYLELPAGDRSGQPDIFGVLKDGVGVLRFDGDGRLILRSTSSSALSIPLTIRANNSQLANLLEFRNGADILISYIDSSGNISAPNINVNEPINITLSSGISWVNNPSEALRPKYFTHGEYTELYGAVTRSVGSFDFGSGQIQLGSIPAEVAPPYGHTVMAAAGGDSFGMNWVRVQVQTPSLGASNIVASAPADFEPSTIYLDNIRFYRGL